MRHTKEPRAGKARRERAGYDLGPTLEALDLDRGRKTKGKDIARVLKISPGAFSDIKNGRTMPKLQHLKGFSTVFDEPIVSFLPKDPELYGHERDGLHWRICPSLVGTPQRQLREATDLALMGRPPAEIARRIAEIRGPAAAAAISHPGDTTVLNEVRGAFMMGVITPSLSLDRSEILDLSLGEELAQAIAAQTQLSHPITVRVVRNFGHPDFESDPIAPVFVAYVAHRLVAQVLEQNLYARTIGIAGGNHVATFVRLFGLQSSPFPAGGDRPYKLLPLTLEPLHDHRLELADALVGEARGRAAPLLGDERIEALSFKPTGYVVEDKVVRTLDPESVLLMRENYHNMDVAIYGCGDGSDRNWLKSMGLILGLEPMPEVKTDVCLHMLSETGAPIALTEGSRRRDFQGVSLEQIRAVAARRGKLALLLVSGASKGLPIAIVARAGYCNAIVCDQAAARAAMQALRGERAVG